MPDVLVYGDEDIKILFSQREQLAIFFAAESLVPNRLALVPALGKKYLALRGKHSSRSNFISEWPPS